MDRRGRRRVRRGRDAAAAPLRTPARSSPTRRSPRCSTASSTTTRVVMAYEAVRSLAWEWTTQRERLSPDLQRRARARRGDRARRLRRRCVRSGRVARAVVRRPVRRRSTWCSRWPRAGEAPEGLGSHRRPALRTACGRCSGSRPITRAGPDRARADSRSACSSSAAAAPTPSCSRAPRGSRRAARSDDRAVPAPQSAALIRRSRLALDRAVLPSCVVAPGTTVPRTITATKSRLSGRR